MLKNIGFNLLIANLVGAIVLVILNLLDMNLQSAVAIAILGVTLWMTMVVIVKDEKQTGVMGMLIAFICLILTITLLSIIASIVNSLTLRGIWDAFIDTFRADDILGLVLAIAAVVVAVAIPLSKK